MIKQPISLDAPDLIINELLAVSDAITVVIRNQGNSPVVDAFWVDVYLNPNPVPNQVNQHWQDLGSQGLVWGVTTVPITPGEVLTLTLTSNTYRPDFSNFVPPLGAGTVVYGQVDSINLNTTFGGVLEDHEIVGTIYNNITYTVSTDSSSFMVRPGHDRMLPPAALPLPRRSR
jgi:hypothetical protein